MSFLPSNKEIKMEISRTEHSEEDCFTVKDLSYMDIFYNNVKYICCVTSTRAYEENNIIRKKVIDVLHNLSKEDQETLFLLEIEFRETYTNHDEEKRNEIISLLRDFWELHGGDPRLWSVLSVKGPYLVRGPYE